MKQTPAATRRGEPDAAPRPVPGCRAMTRRLEPPQAVEQEEEAGVRGGDEGRRRNVPARLENRHDRAAGEEQEETQGCGR
jgi:hypothetical protein